MKPFNPDDAAQYVMAHIDPRPFQALGSKFPDLLRGFAIYDRHYMNVCGVLDENGLPAGGEYDDDDAFEFIYDAYLSEHPKEEDTDMRAAALLNRYMELTAEYWNGLDTL